MQFSIQQKLFFLLCGLTVVVLVAVLLAVNSTASTTIREDVLSGFKQTQGFFKVEQNLRYDRLVESAYLIQENSTFKANVELNDPPTVNYVVEQFGLFIKADLFVVTNDRGSVLSWLGRPDMNGKNLSSSRKTVAEALRGVDPPFNIEWPELWAIDGELFQVVTVPTYLGNSLIGTITLGTRLTAEDAKELTQNTSLDITFFLNRKPIASSADSPSQISYDSFLDKNSALIDSVLSKRSTGEPFTNYLGDTENFGFISPLGKGESAFYIATVPTAKKLSVLSKMQRNIFIIAGIALLIIIPLVMFLGRFFSRPVNRLTRAMARVEQGQFDVSVTPSTNDEIGQMTVMFNKMVGGLKERFALQKYVGSHTLDMIQSSADDEVKLGGRKTELAILFSDIRGSTSTIESCDPEEFVAELNKLLSQQSQIVVDHEGSIDKYVGDSIIALFSGEDALQRAMECSIDMQKTYNQSIKDKEPFFGGLGIGLNFGTAVLGNMGGDRRMDYTVIGPEVNLCARLCDAAPPGKILIPEYLIKNIILEKTNKVSAPINKSLKGFSKKINIVEIHYE
jgi:class 3 adenylate cyclase